jgi:hypothetical protein
MTVLNKTSSSLTKNDSKSDKRTYYRLDLRHVNFYYYIIFINIFIDDKRKKLSFPSLAATNLSKFYITAEFRSRMWLRVKVLSRLRLLYPTTYQSNCFKTKLNNLDWGNFFFRLFMILIVLKVNGISKKLLEFVTFLKINVKVRTVVAA